MLAPLALRRAGRICPLLLFIVLAIPATVIAETDGPFSDLFFDTVEINVVNVEVLVSDRDGQPVTGLTKDDFELFEDGRPVAVSNFFATDKNLTSFSDQLTSDQTLNQARSPSGPETTQLNLVIFIDDSNIRPQTRNQLFKNLRTYLDQGLAADDQVMLVRFDTQLEVLHEFTSDAAALVALLEPLEKKISSGTQIDTALRNLLRDIETTPELSSTPGTGLGINSRSNADYVEARALQTGWGVKSLAERLYLRGVTTAEVLAQFSDSLAGLPGRKAIVYLSDGISLRPSDALTQAWLNKFSQNQVFYEQHNNGPVVSQLVALNHDLSPAFEDLAERASSNGVAFYPISVTNSGFVGSYVSAQFTGQGVVAGGLGARSQDVASLDETLRQSSLLQLAETTGGLALTNTTNIGGLLDTVKNDFRSFYSLGYSPQPVVEGEKERFRKLRVRLRGDGPNRRGWTVRHIKGFKERGQLDRLKQLALAACHYGKVDNALAVEVEPGEHLPGAKTGQFQVPLMVKIPFSNLLLLPEESHHTGRVSMFVVVRDPAGGTSPIRHIELPIQVPNSQILEALAQKAAYPLLLELGEGPKRISLGLRDNLARISATVNFELDVGSNPAPSRVPTAEAATAGH